MTANATLERIGAADDAVLDALPAPLPHGHMSPAGQVAPVSRGELSSWRRPSGFTVSAVLLFLLAIFQNFYRIATAPLLSNEDLYTRTGWLYVHWSRVPAAMRESDATNVQHPPLAKLLFGLADLVVGHPSVTAGRIVDACCTVVTSLVLAWWLAAMINRWVGLFAGALLALIPMPIFLVTTRFGRVASLDTVAELFMVASLALAWRWSRTIGRSAWWYAVATGLAIGLATASKENACMAIAGPMLMSFYAARTSWSRLGGWLLQSIGMCLVAAGSFVACYLPFGDPLGHIRYMLAFQADHSVRGHLIGVAGQIDIHPPWWANFWFAGHSLGSTLTTLLVGTALFGILARHDATVAWLVSALLGPIAFHCFYAGVALPYYWTLFAPAFLCLSAIGSSELWRMVVVARHRWIRAAALMAGVAVAAGLAVQVCAETARVATLHPEGPAVVAEIRADRGLHGTILAAGTYDDEILPLLGDATVTSRIPGSLASLDTILVAQPRCARVIPRGIRALVQRNLDSGALRLVHVDRLMSVYLTTDARPLVAPTKAEIDAQPIERLADKC